MTVLFVAFSAWALCARLSVPTASALAHSPPVSAAGGKVGVLAPTHDEVVFPVPADAVPGFMPRLPTNEENALVVVEEGAHADTENLKEIEELVRNPVSEADIAEEREALQEAGQLPTDPPVTEPPSMSSDAEAYNEGTTETTKTFGAASSTVESDGAQPEDDPNERLKHEVADTLSAARNLPSLQGESEVEPAL